MHINLRFGIYANDCWYKNKFCFRFYLVWWNFHNVIWYCICCIKVKTTICQCFQNSPKLKLMCTLPMVKNRFGYSCSFVFIASIVLVCSDASSLKIPKKTSGGVSCFRDNFWVTICDRACNKKDKISHLKASLTTCSSNILFLFSCSFVS